MVREMMTSITFSVPIVKGKARLRDQQLRHPAHSPLATREAPKHAHRDAPLHVRPEGVHPMSAEEVEWLREQILLTAQGVLLAAIVFALMFAACALA